MTKACKPSAAIVPFSVTGLTNWEVRKVRKGTDLLAHAEARRN